MDFGVVQTDRFPEQTTSGQFLGTIRYGAPEYLFGEASTTLVDVFAFGAIAYELFFGDVFLGREQHWARLIARKDSGRRGQAAKTTRHSPRGLGSTMRNLRSSYATEHWLPRSDET
jgi:serine/threonine protein kinase